MNYSESLITGKGVTLSEALATGGATTVTGMGIVFGVLLILMIVLMLFKIIFYKEPAKTAVAPVEAAPEIVEESVEEEDEEELIAVLTAAVAASLNTSTYNLQIKSYRRIGNNRPSWNRAGLNETIGNRF